MNYYEWTLHNINMESAWSRTFGDPSITIAICDSGIATSHPDLNPKITRNADGTLRGYAIHPTANATYPFEDDVYHGTFVSGIAGALTQFAPVSGTTLGIAGVCPLSPILPIKITHDALNNATVADATTGINYALSQPDVKVINISFAGYSSSNSNDDVALQSAVASAYSRGVLLVSIMGNYFDNVSGDNVFPGGYFGSMTVGASDVNNNKASYSNTGNQISVTAPGGDTYTVYPYTAFANCQAYSTTLNGGYNSGVGTSFAAPHVAGLGSLLFAQFPTMMGWDVRGRMEDTAADINAAAYPGYDTQMGWGLIDANLATQPQALFATSFPASGSYARIIGLPLWSGGLDVVDKSSDPARLFPNTGATVMWWDPATGNYQQYASYMVPRIGAGRGYFVNFPTAMQTTTYTGAYAFQNPNHPVTVHLLPGWNLISAPGVNPTTWNKQNIKVNYQGSVLPLAQAAASPNNWTLDFAWHLNPQTQQYEPVNDTPGTLHQLVAPEGYWFKSNYELDLQLPGS